MIALGPFDLYAQIGKGGAGQVWSAVHREQNLPVAIKFLTPHRASNPTFRAVFHNEVRAVASLNHPHIVRVFDYGEVTTRVAAASDGSLPLGSPYLAMELVRGGTLDDMLGKLGWPELRHILARLLDALAHAHARGVIHRDIKPGNVLLAPKELDQHVGVKLTDFGLAHAFEVSTAGDRRAEGGTPAYMAPEQVQGRWYDFGPWTDLYSLGCLAYYLASGRPPFGTSKSQAVRRAAHLYSEAPPLEPILALPDGYEDWIRRLLAKTTDHRFQCAADAMVALLSLGDASADATVFDTKPAKIGDLSTLTATGFLTELTSMHGVQAPSVSDEVDETEELMLSPPPQLPLPPFPPRWERPDPPKQSVSLQGAGLGLYGLRSVPYVGRTAQRSQLWEVMGQVRERGGARVVVVSGTRGVGKSRLCEWLVRRAFEVGTAVPFRVFHGAVPGLGTGLDGALQAHFRAFGMSRGEVAARVEYRLRRLGVDDPDEWLSITEWIHPSADEQGERRIHFSTQTERYLVLIRLLERLARRRPVILFADDVQWGTDTLLFVKHLLASREAAGLPVLVLMSVTDDLVEEGSIPSKLLADLRGDPQVTDLTLGPLPDEECKALVRELLHLDPALASKVEARATGNPQYAVQLVGDWVQRGILVPGDQGFVMSRHSDARLPKDLAEIWSQRVERVLERLSEEESAALEMAATLGLTVDAEEWSAACDLAGLEASPRALSVFMRQNLARTLDPSPEVGFSFAHDMVREVLNDRAERGGRAHRYHRSCAVCLASGHDADAARVGRHWLQAGEPGQALQPLINAARRLRDAGELARASLVLVDHEQALRQLDARPKDPRWCLHHLEVFRVSLERGDTAEAKRALERAAPLAQADEALGLRLEIAQARLAWRSGELKHARELLEDAQPLADGGPETSTRAQLYDMLGQVCSELGDNVLALQHVSRAGELFDELGEDANSARAWHTAASIYIYQGRYAEATELHHECLERFQAVGQRWGVASATNSLGDLARYRGDLDKAEQFYRRARDLFAAIGSASVEVTEYNLALTLLERGDSAHALAALSELRHKFEERGSKTFLADTHLALASCFGALGDWDAWQLHYERSWRYYTETAVIDEDSARMAELVHRLALDEHHPEQARKALEIARHHWKGLGRGEELARVEEMLAIAR